MQRTGENSDQPGLNVVFPDYPNVSNFTPTNIELEDVAQPYHMVILSPGCSLHVSLADALLLGRTVIRRCWIVDCAGVPSHTLQSRLRQTVHVVWLRNILFTTSKFHFILEYSSQPPL